MQHTLLFFVISCIFYTVILLYKNNDNLTFQSFSSLIEKKKTVLKSWGKRLMEEKRFESESLGEIIARKRELLGISQRELAKAAKLNHVTINRLETVPGIVADPRTLKMLSEALDIDYNLLLARNGTIDDQPEIRMIARASAKMDEEEIRQMMDLLVKRFKLAFAKSKDEGI